MAQIRGGHPLRVADKSPHFSPNLLITSTAYSGDILRGPGERARGQTVSVRATKLGTRDSCDAIRYTLCTLWHTAIMHGSSART